MAKHSLTEQNNSAFALGRQAALNGYERRSPYRGLNIEESWYKGFDSVASTAGLSPDAVVSINKFYGHKLKD